MNDEFVIVTWPDVQELFEYDDFNANAQLVDAIDLITEYGSSAFFVRKSWLNNKFKNED